MKVRELQNKKASELQGMLGEHRAKLQQLRFDLAGGKVKNVREIRDVKKTIARILTLLRKTA